ncbi:hypothetical protein WL21_04450 [Burkholderia ubonensis]|nr:hypothetical protein WJ81_15420 [Burkholderia ubonensis]KVZ57259.1 hypothetical protein WL20_23205 [Burkholderia ubonensis]KVZ72957.1 hypothetical protein WL21_04450 [Burkholderia ubonensis]
MQRFNDARQLTCLYLFIAQNRHSRNKISRLIKVKRTMSNYIHFNPTLHLFTKNMSILIE